MEDRYKVIVVDPPWPTKKTGKRTVRSNQGTVLTYSTLSIQDIQLLQLDRFAAENCLLFIWATNARVGDVPILVHAYNIGHSWGFKYYTTLVWDKRTGVCPFGPVQITCEYVLMFYRGKLISKKEMMGKMKSVFYAKVTSHSSKPSCFYQWVESISDGPRLDVFARVVHEGFYGWGDEYEGESVMGPELWSN